MAYSPATISPRGKRYSPDMICYPVFAYSNISQEQQTVIQTNVVVAKLQQIKPEIKSEKIIHKEEILVHTGLDKFGHNNRKVH